MTDFTKTAINQNAKREFVAPIPDIDSFEEVVAAFENDTTMGFTKKKKTECTYKTKIEYYVKNMRFRDALTYAYACRNDKDKLHKVFDKWFINTHGNRVKLEELKSEFEDFWKYEV